MSNARPSRSRLQPSAAMIVAMTALVLAMSGAAVGLKGKDRVGAKDIKRNAVRSQEVKNKSLRGKDVADDTLVSKQVAPESLDSSDLREFAVADDALTRVLATEGASSAAARSAAPETVLLEEGPLTVYAKCFRDAGAGETTGAVYASTNAPGSMLSAAAQLPDDNAAFLEPGTPEPQRLVHAENVSAADAADFGRASGALAAPEGVAFEALVSIGVKQGNPADAGGLFGEGNSCLFGLAALG